MKKKQSTKLRFSLEEIAREVAKFYTGPKVDTISSDEIGFFDEPATLKLEVERDFNFNPEEVDVKTKLGFRETSKGFWINVEDGYYEALKQRYVKNTGPSLYKQVVRIVERCKNGIMVVHEVETIHYTELKLSRANKKLLNEGYTHMMRPLLTSRQVFIKDNGVVSIKADRSRGQYLGFANMRHFAGFSDELMKKLFSLRSNNEWVEEVFNRASYLNINMADIRSSNSLQEFINRINPLDHPVSARWFKEHNLSEIVHKLTDSIHLRNPIAYLKHPKLSDTGSIQIFQDSIKMSRDLGEKFWFNPRRLREKHDQLVLATLKKDTTIHPIRVSAFWRWFHAEYLPDWEHIDEGNRLKMEGLLQRHCVGSYHNAINSGRNGIFSIVYENNERFTLQLTIPSFWKEGKYTDSKNVQVMQIKGFGNCDAPMALVDRVNEAVKAYNEREDKVLPEIVKVEEAVIW